MTEKMKRSIFKNIFLNFEKEETWLNKMCSQGYALREISNGYYIFEPCKPGEYIYRVEFLKQKIIDNKEKDTYINFMKEMNVDHMASAGRWQYFRRDSVLGKFDIYSDIDSKIKHYQRINFIWYLLAIIFIVSGSGFVTDLIAGNIDKSSLVFNISFLAIGLLFLGLAFPLSKKVRNLKKEQKLLDE